MAHRLFAVAPAAGDSRRKYTKARHQPPPAVFKQTPNPRPRAARKRWYSKRLAEMPREGAAKRRLP